MRLLKFIASTFLIASLLSGCSGSHSEQTASDSDSYDSMAPANYETSFETEPDFRLGSDWKAGRIVSEADVAAFGLEKCFAEYDIPDSIFSRMDGVSFSEGCPVSRQDLRYIRILHYDQEGNIKLGEIVANKKIAPDIIEIFKKLFENHYPIASVRLIDEFDGDDIASMQANNTSCFNYRSTTGKSKLSNHAYGLAIDINPLYNPYVKKNSGVVLPPEAEIYADREADFPQKISKTDLAYKEFTNRGFRWGGNWRSIKDYQHFEK